MFYYMDAEGHIHEESMEKMILMKCLRNHYFDAFLLLTKCYKLFIF